MTASLISKQILPFYGFCMRHFILLSTFLTTLSLQCTITQLQKTPPFFFFIHQSQSIMAARIVLITGTTRGIGKGLLELYLAKPHHTIIAANRDPNHALSKALVDLPKAEGTSLLVIKVDATVPTDPTDAVKQLATHGIDHLDIVIANAAIAQIWPKVSEVKVEDMQKHIVPNTYGFIWLYQATLPLLKKSKTPTWVTIGSSGAFLTVSVLPHSQCPLAVAAC